MVLEDIVTAESDEATVTVLNRESGQPLYRLLTGLFTAKAVTVRETTTDTEIHDDVVLTEKNGDPGGFAVSPLDAIRDELLMVNADIYVTGARELEAVEAPDVLTELDEIPFTVRGRPEDPKEKLLLVEMSRHIEAMAWQAGNGQLRTGLQYLSRLEAERGTHQVYERLGAESGVDTHVYGLPDAEPSIPGVTVHGVDNSELRRSWFVVYRSSKQPKQAAALVAVETEPRTWEGRWTYNPERVATIDAYLDEQYP